MRENTLPFPTTTLPEPYINLPSFHHLPPPIFMPSTSHHEHSPLLTMLRGQEELTDFTGNIGSGLRQQYPSLGQINQVSSSLAHLQSTLDHTAYPTLYPYYDLLFPTLAPGGMPEGSDVSLGLSNEYSGYEGFPQDIRRISSPRGGVQQEGLKDWTLENHLTTIPSADLEKVVQYSITKSLEAPQRHSNTTHTSLSHHPTKPLPMLGTTRASTTSPLPLTTTPLDLDTLQDHQSEFLIP